MTTARRSVSRTAVLRYALAPACIGAAALLHVSPVGALLHPMGAFILGVLVAAWFGGAGPGVFAAFLSAISLPHLIAVTYPLSTAYPLLAGFFDLPRFITLGLTGAAVGWGTSSYRRARAQLESAVSERTAHLGASEERYQRAMLSSNAGIWDWDVVKDDYYVSPRLLEMGGFAPGTTFSGRQQFLRAAGFHPQDLEKWEQAVLGLFAGSDARLTMELRMTVHGEARWRQLSGMCFRDAVGSVVRWTGSVTDITERKRAEQELRESEARFRSLTELTSDWYWRQDENLRFTSSTRMSPRVASLQALDGTRYLQEWVIGKARWELRDVTPLSCSWAEHQAVIEARQPYRDFEYARIAPDGRTEYVSSSGAPIFDEQGNFRGYQGIGRDITERKRAEEALRAGDERLRQSEDRYARAMAAAEAGFWDWDVAKDEFHVSPRLLEMVGFAHGTTFAGRADFMARAPFHPEDRDRWLQAVKTLFASGGSRLSQELRLIIGGVTHWQRLDGMCFRDAAGKVVRWTGSATDVTGRKRAEDGLRASEERYALAMEAAGDGHTDWNLATGEFYISPRLLKILGYAPDATFADRADWVRRFPFHPEDRKRWEAAMAAHFAGREAKFRMDLRIVVNGETRWVAFTFIATRDASGKPVRWTGSIADINDAKLAEHALRESQERYALAVAGSDDGVWDVDFAARSVFVSARARELVGMPPGPEVVPLDAWFAGLPLHPEDAPLRTAAMQAHLAGETPAYIGEFRLRQPDGVYRWRRLHGLCSRDVNGNPDRMAGSISDIDARRRAEEALRLSEQRYALAMEVAEEGHFDWNVQTDEIFASARALRLIGVAEEAGRTRNEVMAKVRYHPDDEERIRQEWRAALDGPAPEQEFEYRVLRGDEARWLHGRWKIFRGEHGTALRVIGVIADITERKHAEEARRLSEERYALAMEAAQDAHWDFVIGTDQYYTSPRVADVFGLPPGTSFTSRQDYLAKTPLVKEDLEVWLRASRELFAGTGSRLSMELRAIVHGEVRWIQHNGVVFRDASGRAVRWCGSVRDTTQRRRAEEALRLSEERYALAMEASEEGHFDWNVQTDEIFASAHMKKLLGLPVEEEYRTREEMSARVRYYPGDLERLTQANREVLASGALQDELEYRILRGDDLRWLRRSWKVFRDTHGVAQRVIGVINDITERKRALDTLRESESRFRTLVELNSNGFWVQDENLRYTSTPLTSDVAGHPKSGWVGKTRWELAGDPTPLSCSWEAHRADLAARRPFRDFEYRRVRPDGKVGYYSASGAPIFDDEGHFKGYYGVANDITERKRVEEELRSRQEMLELAQKSARAVAFEWKIGEGEGENRWSADLEAMYGLEHGSYDGTYESWKKLVHRDDWPTVKEAIEHAHRTGDVDAEYRVVHPDRSIHWLHAKGRMLSDVNGRPVRMVGFMHDVTDRKRVEEALRQSEERYSLAVAGSNEGIFDWDLVSDRVYVSYRAQELFGLPRSELWRPRRDWRHIVTFHPEDAPRLHDSIKAHIEGRTPTFDEEFRITVAGGGVRWFRQRAIALRDEAGKAYRVVGSIGNVTERHIVEEELKAMERKLRLAQRLEAMGTLAGGIAHDFNNILGAILGYGEMAMRDAPKGSRLRRDLDSIVTAGERGRALVDRVLAFSRSGVGERVPVHVEKVVREALDLVSAKLPPDVTLHAKLHAGRAAMLGDATQVHQVLMNLATNAIQAMPAGGTLRVSLAAIRVEAPRAPTIGIIDKAEYLVLEVADAGTGIPPDVLDRIFDPFFTTKEVGTGTGLGLSLVHGIVAEVGGAIDVASKVGAGSTFTVYFPRSGDAEDASASEEPELPRGEGQRVLIVDDEEPLVKLATRTLEELGYAPVGFTSSTAALAAFRADPKRFDAVITDERMPGMSGSALIREVRGIRDRIPIVLMSGYVGGALAARAREAGAEEVLKKPLSARDLAASLARVLHVG